jgi:hypothetical protein
MRGLVRKYLHELTLTSEYWKINYIQTMPSVTYWIPVWINPNPSDLDAVPRRLWISRYPIHFSLFHIDNGWSELNLCCICYQHRYWVFSCLRMIDMLLPWMLSEFFRKAVHSSLIDHWDQHFPFSANSQISHHFRAFASNFWSQVELCQICHLVANAIEVSAFAKSGMELEVFYFCMEL